MNEKEFLANAFCDCCGKKGIVGVASSSFTAMSFAFCRECLDNLTEPEMVFHFLYDHVSNKGEGLVPEVNDYNTFKDGKYISWPEWVKWRKTQSYPEIDF